MIDIYKTWVRGGRRRRLPDRHRQAREHGVLAAVRPGAAGLRRVASATTTSSCSARSSTPTREFMSQYTTEGRLQATVDFGFQGSGVDFAKGKPDDRAAASSSRSTTGSPTPTPTPTRCRRSSATTTWAGSGSFLGDTGATGNELLERDEFAHSLMYLTRGQPVVYYGDEQGFVGDGGDQDARRGHVPVSRWRPTTTTTSSAPTPRLPTSNFDTGSPALPAHRRARRRCARSTRRWPTARRSTGTPTTARASSPSAGSGRGASNVEYVVAANNADTTKTATFDDVPAGQQLHLKRLAEPRAAAQRSRPTPRAG